MVSYGLPSTDIFQDINSTMLDDKFPDLRYIRDNYRGSGIINLIYRYVSENEMMFLGISGSYNQTVGDIYNVGQLEGELNREFITVAVEGQYRYQNMNKVQLYSGIGIGYTFGNETLNPPASSGNATSIGSINSIAWQINAIGIRVGKSFAGFAEFGYGYKGIVNVGLSLQLY
ncbi:MAG: hypothetical protein DRJ10_19140 [Bacteroidetes bacterium]|nr:MAG: hypothetical protein DRJ10_19140 [Bacteroidota bacterium]